MKRTLLAIALAAASLGAAAQSTPNANYTDMWWYPNESGWGISFMQHSSRVFATWYTYDARQSDPATGQFKPLWIVMSGGTWTSPNTVTGRAYVLNGVPFDQSGSNRVITDVGSVTFTFSDSSNGTFAYNIVPPTNVAANDPAAGLPPMVGSRPITRFAF